MRKLNNKIKNSPKSSASKKGDPRFARLKMMSQSLPVLLETKHERSEETKSKDGSSEKKSQNDHD